MLRFTRLILLIAGVGAALCLAASAQDVSSTRGRKFKEPPPTAHIEIEVVRATNGKPIENASVIFHQLDGHDKGNMQLKTNEDGKTIIDVLEIGANVRFQVIAQGYQTYGQDFKVEGTNLNLLVKLSRPVDQYSTYKDHSKDNVQTPPVVQTPNAQSPQSTPTQNPTSTQPK
jgi:opacity protein-like surface antigen